MTECKQPGTQTTKAFHVSELGEGIKKTGEKKRFSNQTIDGRSQARNCFLQRRNHSSSRSRSCNQRAVNMSVIDTSDSQLN